MDHLIVVKAANHVQNGVGLANVRKELIAQAFPLARACNDTRDVDELHRGWNDRVWFHMGYDLIEPRVGHGDHADIGIDRAERIIRRLGLSGGERVKNGRLAHIGQSYDTDVERHRFQFRPLAGVKSDRRQLRRKLLDQPPWSIGVAKVPW